MALVSTLAACTTTPKRWTAMSISERSGAIDVITRICELPRTAFQLTGEDLRFAPDPQTKYSKVGCALRKMQHVLAPGKMGFVGDERMEVK
jgi:hypothetical protein